MPDEATSTPAAPVADSPAPAPTTTETKPTAPTEADISAAIEQIGELSAAQMDAIENGDFSSITTPAEPAPKTETKPAEGEKPAETEPTKPKGDPANIHRISLGGMSSEVKAKMVEFTTLVKGGMSEGEAAAKVFSATAAAKENEAAKPKEGEKPAETTPTAPEVPESIQSIQTAIEAKRAEIAKVKAEYGDTTELTEALQDLKLDLREAQRTHERESASAATFQAEVGKSLQKVMADHSDLWTDVKPGKKKSDFESYCDVELVLAEQENDPVLSRPDWPEHIATRVLEKFFKGRGANSADSEDDPQIPPLPKQSVRLPGSLTGTTAVPGALTEGGIMAAFESLSSADKDALLDAL